MDSNRGGTVVHFDYGGYYSDGVVWNNEDDKIFSIVMKGTLEDVSYSRLVNRICGKLMVDVGTMKLRLSYIPMIVHPRGPSYILDDEDVLGYLMEVNQDQCRSLLHVELDEVVSEKQSNQYLLTNEELLSDGRVNDGDIVGASHVRVDDDGIVAASDDRVDDDGIVALTIRESSNMDNSFMFNSGDLDITPIERGEAVSAEREDGLNLTLGQEFSTKEDVMRAVERAMHQESFQIRLMETRPTVYAVKCRSVGCNWYLRASVPKNSNIFSVATYRKMHTCSRLEMVTVRSKSRGTPRWDAIHVIQVGPEEEEMAQYCLTSTIMLSLTTDDESSGKFGLSGSIRRQMKMELAVAEGHLCNMGRMIEELEGKLRNSLDQVYFGKTREMVCTLRPPAEIVQMRLPDT